MGVRNADILKKAIVDVFTENGMEDALLDQTECDQQWAQCGFDN